MEFITIKFQGSFCFYVVHLFVIPEIQEFLLCPSYQTNHSFYLSEILQLHQLRFVYKHFLPLISLNHYQNMCQDWLGQSESIHVTSLDQKLAKIKTSFDDPFLKCLENGFDCFGSQSITFGFYLKLTSNNKLIYQKP